MGYWKRKGSPTDKDKKLPDRPMLKKINPEEGKSGRNAGLSFNLGMISLS